MHTALFLFHHSLISPDELVLILITIVPLRVVARLVVVVAPTAETRDPLTHGAIVFELGMAVLLVSVGFQVLRAILQLSVDAAQG